MSKWIDADFMDNHYASMLLNPTPDVTEEDKRKAMIILEALRMEKGIDLVRCKECKFAILTYDGYCKYCDLWVDDNNNYIEVYFDGEHFCSDGKRGKQ